MQRISKHISLVLISSSLALSGCDRPLTEEERRQRELQTGGTAAQTGTGTHRSGAHWYPWYHGGTPFYHSGISPAVGGVHSSATHSSVGGSARGGFGSSGHAAVS